jgi:uncharacterized protein YndB with AHSA1/START domain
MMTPAIRLQDFANFGKDNSLTFQRRLPGPIERVWAYLTDSKLRQQWLAAGEMQLHQGSSFELVWRNDDLSASASERPDGFPEVSRANCLLTEVEAPRRLRFTWPDVGDVTIQLEVDGEEVLLTLTHVAPADRTMKLMVGAGWHAHLDILVNKVQDLPAPSFWASWESLKSEYERILPA